MQSWPHVSGVKVLSARGCVCGWCSASAAAGPNQLAIEQLPHCSLHKTSTWLLSSASATPLLLYDHPLAHCAHPHIAGSILN